MTLAVTVALTIYAFTTKTDFTMMGGVLFALAISLCLFGFFTLFTSNPVIRTMYCFGGVMLYSVYLIYDT